MTVRRVSKQLTLHWGSLVVDKYSGCVPREEAAAGRCSYHFGAELATLPLRDIWVAAPVNSRPRSALECGRMRLRTTPGIKRLGSLGMRDVEDVVIVCVAELRQAVLRKVSYGLRSLISRTFT